MKWQEPIALLKNHEQKKKGRLSPFFYAVTRYRN